MLVLEIAVPILTSTFTYALGQIAIGASYLQFGTLSTSMAQTLRIMITVLGTVYLFHDPFSHLQMIGEGCSNDTQIIPISSSNDLRIMFK